MPSQSLNIQFPAAGVVRRVAHSAIPAEGPMPAPWAVNVRLEDSLTKRLRGGSFAGIEPPDIPNARPRFLVADNGDNITDGDGNLFIVESERSVAASGGRVWAVPGVSAPDSHPAEVVYRGRLIRVENNAILASRQGDYSDWDYGAFFEDPGRAFAIQLSEAGEIGTEPTALIPHKDAFLLAATGDSLWVIQGDPTAEGAMRNVARGVGVIASRAWCKDHLDRVFFLSSRGLYTVSASGEGLQPISENAIPEELTGVEDADTVLTYNHADRGVYIRIPSADVSWFFDTERQQLWPYTTDRTESHVLIGPMKLGEINRNGVIVATQGMMASGSADVTWRIVTGETAEEAASNGKAAIESALGLPGAAASFVGHVKYSGVWKPGRSVTSHPRVRAMWACLWLHSAGEWAFERVTMQVASVGAWRG